MNKANVFVLLGIVTLLDLVTGQLISSIIVLCAITPREPVNCPRKIPT